MIFLNISVMSSFSMLSSIKIITDGPLVNVKKFITVFRESDSQLIIQHVCEVVLFCEKSRQLTQGIKNVN